MVDVLKSAATHVEKAAQMIRRHPNEIHEDDGVQLWGLAQQLDEVLAKLDNFIV